MDQAGLIGADDILIVAEPDLANMRNAKNMLNMLKASRPTTGRRCTASIRSACRSARKSKCANSPRHRKPAARGHSIRFAAVRRGGQQRPHDRGNRRQPPYHATFLQIAHRLTGRGETKKPRRSFLSPIFKKLRAGRRRA